MRKAWRQQYRDSGYLLDHVPDEKVNSVLCLLLCSRSFCTGDGGFTVFFVTGFGLLASQGRRRDGGSQPSDGSGSTGGGVPEEGLESYGTSGTKTTLVFSLLCLRHKLPDTQPPTPTSACAPGHVSPCRPYLRICLCLSRSLTGLRLLVPEASCAADPSGSASRGTWRTGH